MEPLTPSSTLNPRAKGISFAFVFSIFLYVLFFHIFSLSPSDLINNTKFWFLISNTLVVIIAADYSVFLSSSSSSLSSYSSTFSSSDEVDLREEYPKFRRLLSDEADLREEYPKFRRQRSAFSVRTPFPGCESPSILEEDPNIHNTEHYYCNPHHETRLIDNLHDKLQLTPQKNSHATPEFGGADGYANRGEVAVPGRRRMPGRQLHRSLSEANAKRVVFDESRNVVRTFECKRDEDEEQDRAWECTKADEYSRLSNEELNQRVEDFIKRFNNQIRVQAAIYH